MQFSKAVDYRRPCGRSLRTIFWSVLPCLLIMTTPASADDEDRRLVVNRLEVMQFALPALMEAERHDAVDMLCRAIHANEMRLKERTDAAARIIVARAPKDEKIVELLTLAEAAYREFGAEERAATVRRNIESLWKRQGREHERVDREPHEGERHARSEREVARHYIEIMRTGVPALLEKGRRDTAELLEHAIHARELALDGRRDEEANHIRETAPDLAAQIEILNYAAKLWDEFGHEGKAGQLRELAGHFRQNWERRRGGEREEGREPRREHERDREREIAMRQLEQMRYALVAFREVEAGDAADLMHRAIRAAEVRLEGRDDREANRIVERAPKLGTQIELLQRAAGILREFGATEKAMAVSELAKMFAVRARRSMPSDDAPRRERDVEHELDEIREMLEHLQRMMHETMERLETVQGEIRQ